MPTFGRSFLSHWWLDPAATYLNHGTVGATPRVVLDAQHAWQRRAEAQPAAFLFRELMRLTPDDPAAPRPLLRQAADAVGEFVGVRGDDLVFVDNASTGVNAVLRSIALRPGDEIVVLDQAYGAVIKAAEFVARAVGAKVVVVATPFPVQGDPTGEYADAVERALTPRTRLAILDHISSHTALTLPVAEMTARCRARGVPVLIDGAHAPGAIALDVAALGADWYVGNLHKWAFAPRGCGVLWAAPERRRGLHPAVISWGVTNDDWLQEFDWTGTRDPSPWLAAPAGLDFMHTVLGVAAMREHNHRLAWEGARHLAARWGRPWTTPEAMVGCMASVPLPERLGPADAATAQHLRDVLLFEHGIEIPVIALAGGLWLRLSIQVYNDEGDIERLAEAVDALH